MRKWMILTGLSIVCIASPLPSETLGDVWQAWNLPKTVLIDVEARQPITSYAASADASPFLIAYYDDDGSGLLPAVLHVIRFDTRTNAISRRTLRGAEIAVANRHTAHRQVSTECMGSALKIVEANGLIGISNHINPSAGCVLVLKPDLSFVAELFGWVLGRVGDDLIFEENTIHFAATHPLRVDVYNVHRRQLQSIYPATHDAAREKFANELRRHLPAPAWCAGKNTACDPETFTAEVEDLAVDEPKKAITLDVRMNADEFGEKDEAPVKPEIVHYTYAHRHGRWVLQNQELDR